MTNSIEYTTHVGPANGPKFAILKALGDHGGAAQFRPAPSGGWGGFDPVAMVDAFGPLVDAGFVKRDPSAPHYFRITDTGRAALVAAILRNVRRAATTLEGAIADAELAGASEDQIGRAVQPTASTLRDAVKWSNRDA